MDAETASRRFVELFPAIYRRFHRRLDHSEYLLTRESLAVLRHLADTGPLTVGEAAKHLSRSQPAMSEMIQRLVRRGMLERMRDERDRRRVLVWLTEEGRATLRRSERVLSHELVGSAMSQMPAMTRGQLIAGVEALLDTGPEEKDDE
jgi:DNA-binding MarR family transcriptional regulator